MEFLEGYDEVKVPKCTLQKEWEDIEHKLAVLLINNVIFCNNGWWYEKENKG